MNDDNLITYGDIVEAKQLIQKYIVNTPIIESKSIVNSLQFNLYFKIEAFQKLGSFKLRGVMNKFLHMSDEEKSKGVATISAGNHALSLAFAASKFKIPAVVIMPEHASPIKIKKVKEFGAEVILIHDDTKMVEALNKVIEERNLTLVHPFDDPFVIAGQGTIGLEILNQLPFIPDYVIVPVGGGGLISGIATAIKSQNPDVKMIGIEPEGADALSQSLEQNRVVSLKSVNTVAGGLGAPFAGEFTLAHAKKYVDKVVEVTDDDIIYATKKLLIEENILTEPSGAASLAGLLSKKVSIPNNSRVLCVLSGGNFDIEFLRNLLIN